MIDRYQATRRLVNRWFEQCAERPAMRRELPLSLYVARNLETVMAGELLAEYEEVKCPPPNM